MTRKKKTEEPKSEHVAVNLIEYGYQNLVNQTLKSLEGTWYGERIPTDPAEQAKFWKDKLDREVKRSDSLKGQVDLLKDMIATQMNRSNNNDCC